MAILSLGIEDQEVTVAEAQAQAAEAMDKVMAALKAKVSPRRTFRLRISTFRR